MRGGAWVWMALASLVLMTGGDSALGAPVPTVDPGGAAGSGAAAIPGGDFEDGLSGWAQSAGDGSLPFLAVAGPPNGPGGPSASCDLPPGVEARLARSVPIAPGQFVEAAPDAGRPGTKLEFGVWVWLAPTAGGGDVWLELAAAGPSGITELAASPRWSVDALPKSRWLFLATRPLAGSDGRVPSGATELRYRLNADASGALHFDAVRVRRFEKEEVGIGNASFEVQSPLRGGWQTSGAVSPGPTAPERTGYYGSGYAALGGGGEVQQTLELESRPGRVPALGPGELVEAGAWLAFEGEAGLPLTPHPELFVELEVFASSLSSSVERRVASGRWYPARSDADGWVHLETEPEAALSPGELRLRVALRSTVNGTLAVDFAQLGQRHAVDGNPRRRVGANYVGRFRSELFPGASTSPVAAQGRWRNWHWQLPPACDSGFSGFFHSPDCATSPTCLRANGRRDVAVSVEAANAPLPLAGAYDSRDPDVLRYHLQLAAAAGIDHFVYDWQGQLLAEQDLQQGGEALNAEAFEALLAAASRPGCDVKIATMYEPKVHLLGWVLGQPTLEQKVAGITADLAWLAERQRGSRAALRRDGRLVVFLFRNLGCDPSGTQCLDEGVWATVRADVLAQTGEDLLFVADAPPQAGSALEGFTRWRLIARELLRYRTWDEARQGVPSIPAPSLAALESHVDGLAREVADWAAEDDAARLGVLTVWPHFDDTGVGGWGVTNLNGEDGAPLCVRVLDDFDGALYSTTVEAAFEHGFDWVQIATWNDWNEETRLEPAWHRELVAPTPVGQPPSASVHEHVFGRLEATRQWIEAFEGQPSGGPALRAVALRYLSRARRLAQVVAYD